MRSNNLFSAWCVAGDFNAVRCADERKGIADYLCFTKTVQFNEFVEDMDLTDLPLIGRKYTWHRANGRCMSRLDRFLLSDEWMNQWQDLAQWGMKRSIADHYAIVLKSTVMMWCPRPFRVLNCWLTHGDFENFVISKWGELNLVGWGSYVLKEKMKMLRNDLKSWTKSYFGNMVEKILEVVNDIKKIDDKGETSSLLVSDIMERKELFESF